MCTIAESNVLLRAQAQMPAGFKVATEEFRDGWNLIRTGGKRRLEKKVQTLGWNFFKFADGALRSGVGQTSQEAIASALKLALRRIGEHPNAAVVERIELTQYPWFFLARVLVFPYRIQEGAELPMADETPVSPGLARQRHSRPAGGLFSGFGSSMPMLKQMLTSSGTSEAAQ